MFLHSIIQSG